MTSFSERYGYYQIRSEIQKGSMDSRLKNALWNALYEGFLEPFLMNDPDFDNSVFMRCLWKKTHRLVDELPGAYRDHIAIIKGHFFNCDWHDVYSLLEFIVECAEVQLWDLRPLHRLMDECNAVLERHVSAYRFVAGEIREMTSECEIDALERAVTETRSNDPASVHLIAAAKNVFSRDAPDYRTSIKESISAGEAMCRTVVGHDKVTLGDCMKMFRNEPLIHPSLREAFSKLYGWTNDASGIRHALTEESTVTFDDAKFMLVACSAFVSYLRAKSAESSTES